MVSTSTYPIIVVGYPRSGTAWLARLLGDILDSPVGGISGIDAIATEGLDRKGRHRIFQRHATPCNNVRCDEPLGAWHICTLSNDINRVVHIVRHPFDIAVSWYKFFETSSLMSSIMQMVNGHSEGYMPGWCQYVKNWHRLGVITVKYEHLVRDPFLTFGLVLGRLGFMYPKQAVIDTIERQSFEAKRKQIEIDGESRPYGKERQLQHLRKGVVGDWRNYFDNETLDIAWRYFDEGMRLYGYEVK